MPPPALLGCTVVTRDRLSRAAVLADSFRRHHPTAPFVVVSVDPLPGSYRPPADVVDADALGVRGLYEAVARHRPADLATVLMPRALAALLAAERPRVLVYLDPDQLVFRPLGEAIELAAAHDLVLHAADRPAGPAFTTATLAGRWPGSAGRFFDWWADRAGPGPAADVLGTAQAAFPAGVLDDLSYGVTAENAGRRRLRHRNGRLLVRGRPLTTFRYRGPGRRASAGADPAALRAVAELYDQATARSGVPEAVEWGFGYHALGGGVPFLPVLRDLYLSLADADRARFGNPFRPVGGRMFLNWATRPAADGGLSPLLGQVYRQRPDLHAAFPDPAGADRAAFLGWASTHGALEFGYDPRWVGPAGAVGPAAVDIGRLDAPACRPTTPDDWSAGTEVSYPVVVTNHGPTVWTLPSRVEARWEPAAGGPPAAVGSVDFLTAVPPGGSATLSLTVPVPAAGEYTLTHAVVGLPAAPHRQPVRVQEARPAAGFGVNVVGHLRSEKGLGEAARSLAHAAAAAGLPVALNDFADAGSRNQDATLAGFRADNPYPVNLLAMNADTLTHYLWGAGTGRLKGRYNVGYWFWELPAFPPEWRDRFAYVDEVWVGSRYTQEAVAAVSPVPVVRVPPVVRAEDPGPVCGRDRFGVPDRAFLFAFLFDLASSIERKNPLGLIDAFYRAFPDRPDVRLVVKTSRGDLHPAALARVRAAVRDDRVRVLDGVYPRAEVNRLLALADCYVSLHRSEGFGLTLAEAMRLGKPVIGTAYSAPLDFMTPRNSLLVGYRPVTLDRDDGPYRRGNTWADPDLDHAAELMRRAAGDPDLCRRLGDQARQDIDSQFSPEAVGRVVRDRLAELARMGRIPPLPESLSAPVPVAAPVEVAPLSAAVRPTPDEYQRLRDCLRAAVEDATPAGSVVAVAGKGDPELVRFAGRKGWHFPRTPDGTYAGHHPAGDADALAHLAALQAVGATHFLLPATAHWWQAHYPGLIARLRGGRVLADDPAVGLLVELTPPATVPAVPPARCSVVIPVFNKSALTRDCLEAVLRTVRPGTDVVVVDDASTDDTPAVLAGYAGRVRVVRHDRNRGFAAACNAGAAAAGGEYLVFLNNDTVPQPGWLDALERFADARPAAGVVGAKLLYPNRTVQHAGLAVGPGRYLAHIYVGFPADHPCVNVARQYPIVTGACVLVRRAVYDQVGGFDTAYQNSYEDAELCFKARAAGAEVWYCPDAELYHLESATRGELSARKEWDARNCKLFLDRWGDQLVPDITRYYQEDGLLRFVYQDQGHLTLHVSPLLGKVAMAAV